MDNINLWGEPTEYRGIKFYPLHVDEYDKYLLMLNMLGFSKNSINDINIIHMSYLKFMLFETKIKDVNNQDIDNISALLILLENSIHTKLDIFQNIKFKLSHNPPTCVNDFTDILIEIDDVIFNQSDFDKIREIILEQNGVSLDYINQYDPTLEDKLAYVQKGIDPAEFDEQIMSFSAYMRMPLNEVKKYTFYQFKKTLDRINLLLSCQMFKPLEVSGQISFKDGSHIDDWLDHEKTRGRYDSILVSKDKFVEENDFFKVASNSESNEIDK